VVALQEYKEYNNLPHWISGTTQRLKHWIFPFKHFCILLYS
jgi:hypothetical protein